MGKIKICAFLILSCTFIVACRADQMSLDDMKDAITSASKVVLKYRSEFDKAVNFVALQDAIGAVDEAMLGYQGTANKHLSQLKRTNSEARNTYEKCVSPVFQWCISVNSTLDIFLRFINNPKIKDQGKLALWRVAFNALGDGMTITSTSVKLLHDVKDKTAEVKNLLDDTLRDMHTDFSPSGFYGQKKQELEERQKQELVKKQQASALDKIFSLLSAVFTVVARVVTGPIGVALGLLQIFISTGLGNAVSNPQKANYDEQIKAIETFFNQLDVKIRKAIEVASQVQGELVEDEKKLAIVAGKFQAVKTNQELINTPEFISESGISFIVPLISQLRESCVEYATWHGYGSKGYEQKHSRARRQASEDCYEQRVKTMKTYLESSPVNSSTTDIISEAHAIFKEMDCESLKEFIPPYDISSMQILDKNAEAALIDEISQKSSHFSSNPLLERLFQSSLISSLKNKIGTELKYE